MILLLAGMLAAAEPAVVVSSLQTEQLAEQCRGKDADATAGFCTGYILGVFDTLSMAQQICPSPTSASTIKAVSAARKYLRSHRKAWDRAPVFLVRDALTAAFPCKPPEPVAPVRKSRSPKSRRSSK